MDRAVTPGLRTRWLYGRGVRHAVAISEAVRARLLAGGVSAEKTSVIGSAVDPKALASDRERGEIRRELGIADDAACLLVLAALVRRKGIDVLLDALARLEEPPPLLVAGDGEERGVLEAQAEKLGLARVRFLGRREDKPALLAACDALVMPSRKEGLGVAALEAMACARPVIATRVGGLAEAVRHEQTGLLVPPGDPDALAAAIARLLTDADLRRRLGAAGPARVAEGHLAEQMCDAYESVYRRVLAGGSP
jgi:glycosyltransferase involved in cell wall biosynthesis